MRLLPVCLLLAGCSAPAPDSLTHADVIDRLKAKGLSFAHRPGPGNAVLLVFAARDEHVLATVEFAKAGVFQDDLVTCTLEPTPQAAREAAGKFHPAAFAWGRFWFRGHRDHPEHLAKVKAALGG